MEPYKPIFEDTVDFGKYLFGDYRNKPEEDTPEEKEIFNQLVSWIKGEYMGTGKGVANINKIMKTLQSVKDKYKDILQNESNILYRLIPIDLNDLIPIIKDPFDFTFKDGKWYYNKYFIYTPFKYIQSWTTKESTAFGFINQPIGIGYAYKGSVNLNVKAVISTKFDDDSLLFNSKFFNSLALQTIKMRQNEILHIGKEPIKCSLIFDIYNYARFIDNASLNMLDGKIIEFKNKRFTVEHTIGSTLKVNDSNKSYSIKEWHRKYASGQIKIL